MARARSALLALRKLLADSPRPILLVDSQRTIQFANPALANWCGVDADALVGERCDYHSEAAGAAAQLASLLSPPPEAFAGQQVQRVITGPGAGAMRQRRATFVPLQQDAPAAAVLIILDEQDISPQEADRLLGRDDEAASLHAALVQLRTRLGPLYELHQLVGDHPAIQRAREQIQVAALSRARVVVQGPAGSGREHVARTIFYLQTPGHAGALVPLSCSLLDAELLQTTISAFIHTKPEIEVTGPASLLLLDVDELSPDAQRSLMAVLNIIELQAHALATATRSLSQLVQSGSYRLDLANYLSTIVIELPPLSARKEDIPLLAQKLLENCNVNAPRQLSGFTSSALDLLVAHDWPGNMDELSDVVRQAHRQASGTRIDLADLPSRLREVNKAAAHPRRIAQPIQLNELLENVERELIQRAMRQSKNNRARAAQLLGISRTKLLRRMSQLGLVNADAQSLSPGGEPEAEQ